MADVAAVFHWSDDRMDEMEPHDLLRWRELAVERARAMTR